MAAAARVQHLRESAPQRRIGRSSDSEAVEPNDAQRAALDEQGRNRAVDRYSQICLPERPAQHSDRAVLL
jgi:hypothetical protein